MSTVPHGAHHSHVSPSKFFQVLVKIKAEEFLGSNIINQDSGSLYLISIYLWYKWGRPKEEIESRNHDINQLIFWKIGCSQQSCQLSVKHNHIHLFIYSPVVCHRLRMATVLRHGTWSRAPPGWWTHFPPQSCSPAHPDHLLTISVTIKS